MNDFLMYITYAGSEGIQIGSFTLHYYSLMWIMAFLVGWQIMAKVYKTDGVDTKLLDPLFFYTFFGAILGARLGEYLFYNPSAFVERPLEVFLPVQYMPGESAFCIPGTSTCLLENYKFVGFQGLASHGATLGLLISSFLYTRKYLKGKNLLWLLDRICIPVAIGGAFVRIGNFINSEIVGKPSDAPWAVLFENQSLSYGEIVPRHPAQLYEAIGYIILFGVVWFLFFKTNKKKYNGYIFGIFFMALFSIRFIIEFFKENQGVEWVAQNLNLDLNNGQILSIPFILIGLIIFLYSQKKKTNETI